MTMSDDSDPAPNELKEPPQQFPEKNKSDLKKVREAILAHRNRKQKLKFQKQLEQIAIDLNTFTHSFEQLKEKDVDKNFANLIAEKNMIVKTKHLEAEAFINLQLIKNLVEYSLIPSPQTLKKQYLEECQKESDFAVRKDDYLNVKFEKSGEK